MRNLADTTGVKGKHIPILGGTGSNPVCRTPVGECNWNKTMPGKKQYDIDRDRLDFFTIRLDKEEGALLRQYAKKNKISVPETFRLFVTWGLEAEDDTMRALAKAQRMQHEASRIKDAAQKFFASIQENENV